MPRKSPSQSANKPPSQRALRVGELIRHSLADALIRGDIYDPDLAGMTITVPEVRMSPDLKIATCYVMPLGGKDAQLAVKALARNAKFIRGIVAKAVDLRAAPDLRFRVDETFAEGERIDALLRTPRVKLDLGLDGDAPSDADNDKQD